MRHGGGGMGGPGGGHNDNPVHAHVGILTAALVFLGLSQLVLMPWKRPAMAKRVMVCTIILLPATVIAGVHPFIHIWWVVLALCAGAWCSEAKEKPKEAGK